MTEPGLHVCPHAPRPLQCKSQQGVGCEGSGWKWGVPTPSTGIRDAAQGDVGVGTPKYPQEASGMVLSCDPMQGGGRPGHVGLI